MAEDSTEAPKGWLAQRLDEMERRTERRMEKFSSDLTETRHGLKASVETLVVTVTSQEGVLRAQGQQIAAIEEWRKPEGALDQRFMRMVQEIISDAKEREARVLADQAERERRLAGDLAERDTRTVADRAEREKQTGEWRANQDARTTVLERANETIQTERAERRGSWKVITTVGIGIGALAETIASIVRAALAQHT